MRVETVDDAIALVEAKAQGRTRYEGQEPFVDELLVGEIKRLQTENYRLAWHLAACMTLAESRTMQPYDKSLACPALDAVAGLLKDYQAAARAGGGE